MPYADEIASLIDVKPNLWALLFEDPFLALKCYFGPCVPAQYRLRGPGAWQGAKDVINTVHESMLRPLRTRKVEVKISSHGSIWNIIFIFLFVLFVFYFCFWILCSWFPKINAIKAILNVWIWPHNEQETNLLRAILKIFVRCLATFYVYLLTNHEQKVYNAGLRLLHWTELNWTELNFIDSNIDT